MKSINEAGWDRIVRVVLGIALLYLGWAGIVAGGWGLFLKIIGFVPLITGLIGFCPIYALLKFHTNKTA
jgi:Inner membrane protein YgaP-like, transmembrane domain